MHLTRTIDGEVLLGPTALMAGARDAYALRTLRAADLRDTLGWPGTWRLAARWWRTGAAELRDAASRRAFVAACARYVPALGPGDVEPGWAGVRAQAVARDGTLVDDFVFCGVGRRRARPQRAVARGDLVPGDRRAHRRPRRRRLRPGPARGVSARALAADLRRELGAAAVPDGDLRHYGHDATEAHGVHGTPAAVVLPADTAGVAAALRCCDRLGVAVVPRGGGTGLAAGAVPLGGEVVLGLERLTAVRALEPERWRMHVEAGLTTGHVHRLARESGLLFPPDPGAAEQSQIGGNVATNAGGPHAFKYGVTGRWVTGLEAVLASGEVLAVGGPLRKDVAGYDLRSLLVGSEGTLAVITAAWLALTPMPEARLPVAAAFDSVGAGCDAIDAIVASGLTPAILEYLDGGTLEAAGAAFPAALPAPARMLVIAEADGSAAEAARVRCEFIEVLGDGALALHAPETRGDVEALWRWRDGVSIAVAAHARRQDVRGHRRCRSTGCAT